MAPWAPSSRAQRNSRTACGDVMRLARIVCPVVMTLVLGLCPGRGFAQGVPLAGRVVDSLGGAINGATVTVSGEGVTTPKTARTGVDGTFVIDAVGAGTIDLTVEAPG